MHAMLYSRVLYVAYNTACAIEASGVRASHLPLFFCVTVSVAVPTLATAKAICKKILDGTDVSVIPLGILSLSFPQAHDGHPTIGRRE